MHHECRHIKTNGIRCHAPSLRNKPYCYFHMNLSRTLRPRSSATQTLDLPPIEDTSSVLLAVGQVLHWLQSPTADTKRAGLMLYSLQIASQLTARREHTRPEECVQELSNESGEDVDFTEATDIGVPILAPDTIVCEADCGNCSEKDTCPEYEEPEEEEEEADKSPEDDLKQQPGDTEDDIDRKFLLALRRNYPPRPAEAANRSNPRP
jgi:hypothetical protein